MHGARMVHGMFEHPQEAIAVQYECYIYAHMRIFTSAFSDMFHQHRRRHWLPAEVRQPLQIVEYWLNLSKSQI